MDYDLIIIGGGFIGLAFGFALAWARSKVTILQSGLQIAPALDDDIRDQLLHCADEAGITIVPNANVTRLTEDKTIEAVIAARHKSFLADTVLLATGRPANIEPLNPGAAGIELDHASVKINGYLQSVTARHIYAVGDAAGKPQHSPVAWYEGPLAAHNAIVGNEQPIDFSVFPTATFTIPAIGQVGLTEKEATNRGLKTKVNKLSFDANPAAGVRDETEGFVKVVYEEDTEKILGVHIIGAGAEDLINIAATGMRGGLKKSQMGTMHYVFPTLAGAIFDTMAL